MHAAVGLPVTVNVHKFCSGVSSCNYICNQLFRSRAGKKFYGVHVGIPMS